MGFTLLPCAKDVCQECAVKHEPDQAHNAESLYYQYKFYGKNGRWPTWADAIAHCPQQIKDHWITALKREKIWKREWELPAAQVPDVMPSEDGTIGRIEIVPIKQPEKKFITPEEFIRRMCNGVDYSGKWSRLWQSPKGQYAILMKSPGSVWSGIGRPNRYVGTRRILVSLEDAGNRGGLAMHNGALESRDGRIRPSEFARWQSKAVELESSLA